MRPSSSLVLALRFDISDPVDYSPRITIPALLPSRTRNLTRANWSRIESEATSHSTPTRNPIRLLNRKRSHHQRDAHLAYHKPTPPRFPNAASFRTESSYWDKNAAGSHCDGSVSTCSSAVVIFLGRVLLFCQESPSFPFKKIPFSFSGRESYENLKKNLRCSDF